MIACSEPPEGRSSQPPALLGERSAALNVVDGISRETVRRTLKNDLKPRLTRCWRIPAEKSGDFAYLMEGVLYVYQRKFSEDEVLVCTAEATEQQTKEVRTALPTAPGRRTSTTNTSATGRRICSWSMRRFQARARQNHRSPDEERFRRAPHMNQTKDNSIRSYPQGLLGARLMIPSASATSCGEPAKPHAAGFRPAPAASGGGSPAARRRGRVRGSSSTANSRSPLRCLFAGNRFSSASEAGNGHVGSSG